MKVNEIILQENIISCGDNFDLEFDDVLIESAVVGFVPGGIIIESDATVFNYLKKHGLLDITTAIN